MVELIVNGEALELDHNTNIKQTKRIGDIFDIAKVNASYTNSFSVPKTPNNTRIFQGLGLVGSSSQIPYQKVPASLKDSGFDLIHNGWLDVKGTGDVYKLNIIDGIIDFFKEIENVNIGDLDLSEINHTKTLDTVLNSFFNNGDYKYIIGDYNGKNIFENLINIDYQVPSARYKYLLEKIFTHFGWTWSGSIFSNEDYLNDWVTFPKSPFEENTEPVVIATMNKGQFVDSNPISVGSSNTTWKFENVTSWDNSNLDEGTLLDNWKYVAPENNSYLINVKSKGFFLRKVWNPILGINGSYQTLPTAFYIIVKKNGQQIGQPLIVFNANDDYQTTYDGYLQSGDIIDFEFRAYTVGTGSNPQIPISLNIQFAEVNISRTPNPEVSFSDEFKDFRVTEFFSDFLRRYGLTVIPNNDNRILSFYTLDERLDVSNGIDWTSKFVRRTNEIYLYGSYAQRNLYKQKYNGANERFNDGILEIDNKNLQNEKTLFTSPFYSRTNDISSFLDNSFVYPIWTREPKESETGEIEIAYKGLTGRFYIIKDKIYPGLYFFISEISGDSHPASNFPILDGKNTHYADLIPEYYQKYSQLLNNCKVHEFEVALSLLDILNLDFTKPVYFEQEASYYLINKVDYESGKTSKLEAIKINV